MAAYAKKSETEKPAEQPERLTAQEYLERERDAETKSEYFGGLIVAMAGASPEHNTLASNLHGEIFAQLRGMPCRPFVSDLRVRVAPCDRYYYPDLMVVCEEPVYEMVDGMRSLLNPTLVIEILSDSTESTDRGEKWRCYQTLESLQTYVLVSQHMPRIEVFQRQENDWAYTSVSGQESRLALDSIGCDLALADIYARLDFPQPVGVEPATQERPS